MMSYDRRPDWNYWKNVPNWTILQAVTLALNIEPKLIRYRVLPGTMGLVKRRDESPEFEKRLSLAIENIETLAVTSTVKGEFENCKITQASFAALAASFKWKVPAQMKVRASSENGLGSNEAMPSKKWPWGSHETKLLGSLAEAAKEFWSSYDPSDSTKAPTNYQVQDWLMERNVPKRTAEVMAKILRADEIAGGNRKHKFSRPKR